MDDKDFSWDDVDQFLKDWENLDKIRDEFIDDIITDAATYYATKNEHYKLKLDDFVKACKKEAHLTAMDYFFVLGDLLYHYDNNKEDFFKFDLDHYVHTGEYDGSKLREWAEKYPQVDKEYVEEMIREGKEDAMWRKNYWDGFHNLMKKAITEYLYNIDILPPRAFRELDFYAYQKADDFQSAFDDVSTMMKDGKDFAHYEKVKPQFDADRKKRIEEWQAKKKEKEETEAKKESKESEKETKDKDKSSPNSDNKKNTNKG